jgi:hypothetical protein
MSERSELDKVVGVDAEIRAFVRQDAAALPRKPEAEGHPAADSLVSSLQLVAETSAQEINNLIAELQKLREKLQSEGARVQREIVEYATLSQSAMRSTQIISESLAHWKRVPDAPSLDPDYSRRMRI